MNSAFLTYRDSSIHYRYAGDGPETVVCFHGFGTFAATFDWLAGHVPGHRFIAIDLPFHGDTKWNNGDTFLPTQLLEIIDQCPHITSQRFALMGYSMGGRISLQLLQDQPQRITRLVLLAPDGLHFNPFYWFSTQTGPGNRMLKKIMDKPEGFVRFVNGISQLGIGNKGMIKFVDRYLQDKHIRTLVYQVWTAFRKFKPSPGKVAALAASHNIPIILIYGRYDSIIPLTPGEKFFARLKGRKRMDILETGHQILHVRNAPYIAEAFNL